MALLSAIIKDFFAVVSLPSSMNYIPASQSVQYVHLAPGLAGQVARVVHHVLDHLSGDQHPQWQHLQIYI